MSGMRSLFVRTARDFVRIMDTVVPELRQYLSSGNRQMALMQLHTLKGNAGTLGVTELAAKAAKLEALCKTEAGLDECSAGLESLETLVRSSQKSLNEAIDRLTPPVAKQDAAIAQPVDLASALLSLRNLSALAATADMEALQFFAENREQIAGLSGELAESLEGALQNLDLAAAHALCESILSKSPG
jgi:HPt (histidine-containing phosphotransfer) domain-containing protein